jgi:N-methylhydantoinase A
LGKAKIRETTTSYVISGAYLIGELEMSSAIVPIAAANFSALGMLMVDIRHDFSQTFIQPLDTINFDELNSKVKELLQKGEVTLQSEGIVPEDRETHVSLDMRYTAQEHTVNVPINFAMDEKAKDKIYEEFTKVYKEVWGYSLPQPAAIVHLRVAAFGKVPKPKLRGIKAGNAKSDQALKGKREVFDFIDRKWTNFNIYERSKLLANNAINGPAIIEESTTTTTVPNGYQCEVDMLGNLIIRRRR